MRVRRGQTTGGREGETHMREDLQSNRAQVHIFFGAPLCSRAPLCGRVPKVVLPSAPDTRNLKKIGVLDVAQTYQHVQKGLPKACAQRCFGQF